MARHNAEMIAQIIATQPSLIAPPFAQSPNGTDASCVQRALDRLAACDPVAEMEQWDRTREALSAQYMLAMAMVGIRASNYQNNANEQKPFAFSNGLAVIPIHGMLLNRFPYSWGFATGYSFIQNQFQAAMDDDDVEMIAFDIDSYGGMAAGADETSQMIYEGRAVKPSVAIVDSSCMSAAYYVASAASRIYSTPSGMVGSIGCLMARPDITEMLEQEGVKVTVLYAGANKLDTSPLVPLSKAAKDRLQSQINDCYAMFTAAVARNRPKMSVADAEATEAGIFSASDAVSAKLIDAVATPQSALMDAVTHLMTDPEDEDDDEQNPDDPDDEETLGASAVRTNTQTAGNGTQAAAAPAAPAIDQNAINAAVQAAMAAERGRQTGILNCAEAAGKAKLASHLALGTTMSVDEARAVLSAAAPETAAPATATTTATPAPNPLETAMQGQGTPGVQPNASGDKRELTMTEKILAAQDAAMGTKNLKTYREKLAH